jgi:hypothetical protein
VLAREHRLNTHHYAPDSERTGPSAVDRLAQATKAGLCRRCWPPAAISRCGYISCTWPANWPRSALGPSTGSGFGGIIEIQKEIIARGLGL